MKRGLKNPVVGMKVQLTGYFLKCTGQQRGSAGISKWLIVACECPLCACGEFVAVNEPAYDYGQWDDIPKDERPKWRHFAIANLQQVGKLPHSADMSDQVKP